MITDRILYQKRNRDDSLFSYLDVNVNHSKTSSSSWLSSFSKNVHVVHALDHTSMCSIIDPVQWYSHVYFSESSETGVPSAIRRLNLMTATWYEMDGHGVSSPSDISPHSCNDDRNFGECVACQMAVATWLKASRGCRTVRRRHLLPLSHTRRNWSGYSNTSFCFCLFLFQGTLMTRLIDLCL